MMLHEQRDSPDGDELGLSDRFCLCCLLAEICFCLGCLLGKIHPPLKFACVGVVGWNVHHVNSVSLSSFPSSTRLP